MKTKTQVLYSLSLGEPLIQCTSYINLELSPSSGHTALQQPFATFDLKTTLKVYNLIIIFFSNHPPQSKLSDSKDEEVFRMTPFS